MTIFKSYFKILNKYKFIIILYIGLLLLFTVTNVKTGDTNNSFTPSRPNVAIINNDQESELINNLINYIKDNADIDDALFYRQVDYVIFIPKGYNDKFVMGEIEPVDIKKTTDSSSSYMDMLIEKYFNTLRIYKDYDIDNTKVLEMVSNSLKNETIVEIKSTRDTDSLMNASFYFNFSNYSILAICIYTISILLSVFNQKKIKRRNLISATSVNKINRNLYLCNFLLAVSTWLIFVVISIFLIGDIMFTTYGMWYMLNSFVFAMCSLAIGFLIGNLVTNQDAINGIVNVVALGSSFLCGSFVPLEVIPDGVVMISKILPSYWYIHNNELIKSVEIFNKDIVLEILGNMGIIVIFMIIFFILTIVVTRIKRKEN